MKKELTRLVAGMALRNPIEVREGEPIEWALARRIAELEGQVRALEEVIYLYADPVGVGDSMYKRDEHLKIVEYIESKFDDDGNRKVK